MIVFAGLLVWVMIVSGDCVGLNGLGLVVGMFAFVLWVWISMVVI